MGYMTNKTILLTGAAGGFGQEYIRQLLTHQSNVIVTDMDASRLEDMVNRSASSIPGRKGNVLGLFASDLSTKGGCEWVYAECKKITARVDILINNAGMINYGYFHEIPYEAWEKLLRVNLLAPMHLTSMFVRDMLQRGYGHIVNMSSVAAFVPTSFETPYTVSKCGLLGFGMALYGELKKKGIHVTNVYPFFANTPLLQSPSYSRQKPKKLPRLLLDEPAMVVRKAIQGICRKDLHVYPGFYAKLFHLVAKLHATIGFVPMEKQD